MKKNVILVMLMLFSLSLVSAHSTYSSVEEDYTYKEKIVDTRYYPDEHRTYSVTTYVNYENDERYPTYDYRHGYSYRTTTEYLEGRYPEKRDYAPKDYKDYNSGYKNYNDYRRESKDYYYEYVSYLREYQKRECYHTAPRGKLFYIKCP